MFPMSKFQKLIHDWCREIILSHTGFGFFLGDFCDPIGIVRLPILETYLEHASKRLLATVDVRARHTDVVQCLPKLFSGQP